MRYFGVDKVSVDSVESPGLTALNYSTDMTVIIIIVDKCYKV